MSKKISPRRGELWFVDLDPIRGREQAKKRPCLVLSNNIFNNGSSGLVIVIPLTSKNKNNPLHIEIPFPEGGIQITSYALPEQIRSVSPTRFDARALGKVSEETMLKVEEITKVLLDFY